jgi:hypothetical protein
MEAKETLLVYPHERPITSPPPTPLSASTLLYKEAAQSGGIDALADYGPEMDEG